MLSIEGAKMDEQKRDPILERVRAHAYSQLPFEQKGKTNLYLDEKVIQPRKVIGPRRQGIVVKRPSYLVFVDEHPSSDWSHPCRYLFYDEKTGELDSEVRAQFPPYVTAQESTLTAFHEPIPLKTTSTIFHLPIFYRCPVRIPDGQRYAILFSGMSNVRHLNNLEFMYRMLVDDYSFNSKNIYVLNYDGALNCQDGVPASYVGDGTAFRMNIQGAGTRAEFESAIDDVKGRIKARDLLFIYTSNHGGWDNTPGSADLCTYPSWDGYHAADLSSKLGELPHFRNLLVVMSQCHSGGFNSPIISASTADATSVSASVSEPNVSSVSNDWNFFGRDWASAQVGHDPYNNPLAYNPDANGNGIIEAEEAFNYAYAERASGNDPVFSENSEAGGDIALGQQYVTWGWWCRLFYEAVVPYHIHLPPEEYYARLHKIQPHLSKLTSELDKQSNTLRVEYQKKVKAVVEAEFGKTTRKAAKK
jgi:peptidase C13-like protein